MESSSNSPSNALEGNWSPTVGAGLEEGRMIGQAQPSMDPLQAASWCSRLWDTGLCLYTRKLSADSRSWTAFLFHSLKHYLLISFLFNTLESSPAPGSFRMKFR